MSSSAITLKDSKFQKVKNKIENAVFNTIYEIYPTATPALTYVNWLYGGLAIILEFIQIIPFFIAIYEFLATKGLDVLMLLYVV